MSIYGDDGESGENGGEDGDEDVHRSHDGESGVNNDSDGDNGESGGGGGEDVHRSHAYSSQEAASKACHPLQIPFWRADFKGRMKKEKLTDQSRSWIGCQLVCL